MILTELLQIPEPQPGQSGLWPIIALTRRFHGGTRQLLEFTAADMHASTFHLSTVVAKPTGKGTSFVLDAMLKVLWGAEFPMEPDQIKALANEPALKCRGQWEPICRWILRNVAETILAAAKEQVQT